MSKRETMSSRDYYGLHNTRDFNKGKSFQFNFDWKPTGHYFNDEYVQDFVSYQGKLYVCMVSNVGMVPTNENYWYFTGMEGQKGEKGDTGTIFIPAVDSAGDMSWSNDAGLPNPSVVNLKGAKGDKGDTGDAAMLRATEGHIQWKGAQDTVWQNLVALTNLKGDTGAQGPIGLSLEYIWDGTKLGIRKPGTVPYEWMDLRGEKGNKGDKGLKGDRGDKGDKGVKGDKGDRGESILLQVSAADAFGKRYLQKRYDLDKQWENVLDLDDIRGPRGRSIIVERNLTTNNIEYRYEDEPATANQVMVYAQDIIGPAGDSIAKMYVADDGYLYVKMIKNGQEEDIVHRAGYVRGDKGNDGRQILLRIDTDENTDPAEAGTWTHIQWKYAGDEYKLWNNLIQINELFNIALRGIKATEKDVQYDPGTGSVTTYKRIYLWNTRTVKDSEGNLEQTDYLDLEGNIIPKELVEEGTWEEIEAYEPKTPYITYVDLEELDFITDAYYDDDPNSEWYHYLIITVSTSTGEKVIRIPVDYFYSEGDGIEITSTKVINVHLDNRPMSEGGQDVWSNNANPDPRPFLSVDENGLRITGLLGKLVRDFQYNVRGDFDMDIIMYDGTIHSVHLPAEYLLSSAKYDPETHILHLYYFDDVTGEEHDLPIPLEDLVDIYGVTDDGGLGLDEDAKFYIKQNGIVESMLSDELQKLLHDHTRIVTYAQALNLVVNNSLEPGMWYLITDYQTIYSENNQILGTTSSTYVSDTYTLALEAANNAIFNPNALVIQRPKWKVVYNINHLIPEDKGVIEYMEDEYGNTANYDFYNRRWYRTREQLIPSNGYLTNTPSINTNVVGVYCFTYTLVAADGTATNILTMPGANIHSNKLTNSIEYPEIEFGTLNNVFILPQLSMNSLICERGFENNTFYVNGTFSGNVLSGQSNSVFVASFLNNYITSFSDNLISLNSSSIGFYNNRYNKFEDNVIVIGEFHNNSGDEVSFNEMTGNVRFVNNTDLSIINSLFTNSPFVLNTGYWNNVRLIETSVNATSVSQAYSLTGTIKFTGCNLNTLVIGILDAIDATGYNISNTEILNLKDVNLYGNTATPNEIINTSINTIQNVSFTAANIKNCDIRYLGNTSTTSNAIVLNFDLNMVEIDNWAGLISQSDLTPLVRTILSNDNTEIITNKNVTTILNVNIDGTLRTVFILTYFDGDRMTEQSIKITK